MWWINYNKTIKNPHECTKAIILCQFHFYIHVSFLILLCPIYFIKTLSDIFEMKF